MKSRWYALISLVIFMFIVVACAPASPQETKAPLTSAPPQETKEPQTSATPKSQTGQVVLRVGTLVDADCWNFANCESWWTYGSLIGEGFTKLGPASKSCSAVPGLAKSWKASEDGRTWTIELHDGITFQDGNPVTAQTVVDFFDWFRSSKTLADWYPELATMESIKVIDDHTLQYTTEEPILNSPDYNWIWIHVLPPYIWSKIDDTALSTFPNYPPIGTGPYKLTEHKVGSYMIFDAYDKYYLGKPPIDRVIVQIFGNTDAIVNALIAGDIDLTTPLLPADAYATLSTAPNIKVGEKPPGTWHNLEFNMAEGGKRHPAVEDPKVREAIDYAIDKQQIVDVALLGHGVTCPSNWACGPNYTAELNPDLIMTPYDPAKANQILDEAGYIDSDGDGVRETREGLPLKFSLFYNNDVPALTTEADLITGFLGKIGIKVESEVMDWGTWTSVVAGTRVFDLALDAVPRDIDAGSIDYWYSCWAAEAGASGWNFSGYCNSKMDELVAEYMYSPEPEGRWKPMFEAQAMLNHDRPFITLAGQNVIQAYRSDRFEFPADTCDFGLGMYSNEGLLQAKAIQR